MNAKYFQAVCILSLVGSVTASARADEGIPSHFISENACREASRACTCEDAPYMEVHLGSQEKARDAWTTVQGALGKQDGPQTATEAVAMFNRNFKGDPRVSARYATCQGYDPAVNSLNKVAGITGSGAASLDPCFCNAFCKDIVDATIRHEQMHAPTILAGLAKHFDLHIGCMIRVIPGRACELANADTLARSEMASYQVGNSVLRNAIKRIAEKPDERAPDMTCTWDPLPATARAAVPSFAPQGVWARIRALVAKFLRGPNATATTAEG